MLARRGIYFLENKNKDNKIIDSHKNGEGGVGNELFTVRNNYIKQRISKNIHKQLEKGIMST